VKLSYGGHAAQLATAVN